MDLEKDSVIGIVGGMGPQSGIALMNSILFHTKASTDQQHLSTMLMSFPKHIVDRTSFLEGELDINPAFTIAEIIRKMENAGATVAGMACNTAHSPQIYNVILQELHKANSRIKMLNMPFETCCYIKTHYPQVRRIGLMTTNGTYRSATYKSILEEWDYEVVVPEFSFQNDCIHRIIYDPVFGIKSNPHHISAEVKKLMNKALLFFRAQKVDVIIFGCTELSFIPVPAAIRREILLIDSTDALARALVREATLNKTVFNYR